MINLKNIFITHLSFGPEAMKSQEDLSKNPTEGDNPAGLDTARLEELKQEIRDMEAQDVDIPPADELLEQGLKNLSNVSPEKLKTMSKEKFLEIKKEERLKYITVGNVESEKVAKGEIKEMTFQFPNETLRLSITAGNVLPPEVGTITVGNEVYSRRNVGGEFFTKNNKRLIIVNDTYIQIGDLRGEEVLNKLTEESKTKADEYLKNNPNANPTLIHEAAKRDIDLKFADFTFSKLLTGLEGDALSLKVEDILTDFDRIRGYNQISNELKGGKYDSMLALSIFTKYAKDNWKGIAKEFGYSDKDITDYESDGEGNMYVSGSEIQNSDSLPDGTWLKGDKLLNNPEFNQRLREVCSSLGADMSDMIKVMKAESGLDGRAVNPTSNATGLIQFMPATARGLGTSVGKLRTMPAIKQLDYVEKYFGPYKGKLNTIEDLYKVVFYPVSLGKPNNFVFGSERGMDYARKVASQNSGIAKFGNTGLIDGYAFSRYVNNHVSRFSA